MTKTTIQTVENLKAEAHYFAAGALASQLGLAPIYGCHFGMRSTRDSARALFQAGYDAAQVQSAASARAR